MAWKTTIKKGSSNIFSEGMESFSFFPDNPKIELIDFRYAGYQAQWGLEDVFYPFLKKFFFSGA